MTQRERVLEHLKKHGSITQLEAAKKYGIYRLSEYIRQLRYDYKIISQWEKGKNRYKEQTQYVRYVLKNK